jgi:putative NIF3 family GTP cyclohydrolase 1 type 2/ribosomal protein S18 acetylase RimI-like enzyme
MAITARQIHEHFRTIGPWVDWAGHTCDGFKFGDPDTEVMGIAVGWQALQSSLEEAHALGCNLFITHEPTFYSHMDDDQAAKETLPARRKREFLETTGMVVYRCHDTWDVFPRLGIVDAWGEFLELGEPLAQIRYHNLYEVPSTSAWELARRIAQRVKALDEQSVQFIGTPWQMVRRLAIGTGAITRAREMVGMGADVLLLTEDGMETWQEGSWLADLGVPAIIVNHMTAEIPGLRRLAEYLGAQYPGVPVHFVGPTCGVQIYATETSRDVLIRMRMDSLEGLPEVSLPAGYTLRPMGAQESWAYLEVMNRSNFAGEIGEAWFEKTFSSDPEYDPSYLQIIWKGDRPVAAAAAWHRDQDGERYGLIHWVGVSDSARGQGLGKAITLAALHRLRERGFARAMLSTHPWRLAAIASYLRYGFRPWPSEAAPQDLWDRVLANLAAWRKADRRG